MSDAEKTTTPDGAPTLPADMEDRFAMVPTNLKSPSGAFMSGPSLKDLNALAAANGVDDDAELVIAFMTGEDSMIVVPLAAIGHGHRHVTHLSNGEVIPGEDKKTCIMFAEPTGELADWVDSLTRLGRELSIVTSHGLDDDLIDDGNPYESPSEIVDRLRGQLVPGTVFMSDLTDVVKYTVTGPIDTSASYSDRQGPGFGVPVSYTTPDGFDLSGMFAVTPGIAGSIGVLPPDGRDPYETPDDGLTPFDKVAADHEKDWKAEQMAKPGRRR